MQYSPSDYISYYLFINIMSATNKFTEILPKYGQLHIESIPTPILCKPKMMPMKSVTLEKLEKMQRDIQEEMKKLKGIFI